MSNNDTVSPDQPTKLAWNYRRNKAKAILTLQGILDGVQADKHLNDVETVFLRAWQDNDIFSLNDGDFIDIREQIDDILEDGVITHDELDDIQSMLSTILEYNDLEDGGYESTVNHLLGFLSGISVDEELNDFEIRKLSTLLNGDPELASKWPANAIKNRVDEILADDVIEDRERDDLLNLIKAVSGQSLMDSGLAYGMSADFSTKDNADICLSGKSICFTGKFLSGSRSTQQQRAEALGASVKKNVTKTLDILVLGAVASRDWRYSSYGRKIEGALEHRMNGGDIEIINEEIWNELIKA
ncbi:BRCT domain-containing protein [Salinivibrio sp. IB872]|jgi:NAD-dependent DNA ligase|uniref:BRCT domain-containing protein n=1 Tax=Salinivibrio sp. IB872 TaxID=1766123 RepID=UPI000987732E|nr:BRCT domain-containing protein [Salinivibrio sp. IB872]OOF22212.1 NAD-dependent DNA ligase [Salinivibrio sp. IB872]